MSALGIVEGKYAGCGFMGKQQGNAVDKDVGTAVNDVVQIKL